MSKTVKKKKPTADEIAEMAMSGEDVSRFFTNKGEMKPQLTFSPSGPLVFEKLGFYLSTSYFLHRKAFYVHSTTQKGTVIMPSMLRILK